MGYVDGKYYLSEAGQVYKSNNADGDELVVAGSGHEHLRHTLNGYLTSRGVKDITIGGLLLITGQLWRYELTGESIEQAFGGGYEVAVVQNKQIIKLDDILYLYFEYNHGVNQELRIIPRISKINYWNDCLIVRVFEFDVLDPRSDVTSEITRIHCMVASPFHLSDHEEEKLHAREDEMLADLPDFNSEHFVTTVGINTGERGTIGISRYDNKEGVKPVIFEHLTNNFSPTKMNFNEDYLNALKTEAQDCVNRETNS